MHATTTTPAPALPGGPALLRARNAAIAVLGIASAAIVAAGLAIGGDKTAPSHTPAAPAASALGTPANLQEHSTVTRHAGR